MLWIFSDSSVLSFLHQSLINPSVLGLEVFVLSCQVCSGSIFFLLIFNGFNGSLKIRILNF